MCRIFLLQTKEEAMQIYVEILKENGSTLCKDDVTIDVSIVS